MDMDRSEKTRGTPFFARTSLRSWPGIFAVVLIAWTAGPARAQLDLRGPLGGAGRASVVSAELLWSRSAALPGEQVTLGVVIRLAEGWHINADPAQIVAPDGFAQEASEIALTGPTDLTFSKVVYPAATLYETEVFDEPLRIFEKRTVCFVPVRISPGAKPSRLEGQVSLRYQACNDMICHVPTAMQLPFELPVVAAGTATEPTHAEVFAAFVQAEVDDPPPATATSGAPLLTWGTAVILFHAAVGGFLLNLTPCVLPMIPIKIMALSKTSRDRAQCLRSGLIMSAGVVAFWLALGAAVATISEITAANQLFQYPLFTIGVGILIAVMAVGMCGVFSVRLPAFVYRIPLGHDTVAGSFGFGAMTAVLSTPCTAPFMGSAVAWAVTQPAGVTMITFSAIGVGMALPYAVLAAFPAWAGRMPQTGPANELIKQIMGLLMLAAASYFVGVGFVSLVGSGGSSSVWWPIAAWVAAAGCWLAWRTFRITTAATPRAVFAGLGVLVTLGSIYGAWALTDAEARDREVWTPYSPAQFDEALKRGDVVVMDFTAQWCLNCKLLERQVLSTREVVEILTGPDVTALKVDITNRRNADGREMLHKIGRATIPVLVVFAPDGSEIFKADWYRAGQVIDAVNKARAAGERTAGR